MRLTAGECALKAGESNPRKDSQVESETLEKYHRKDEARRERIAGEICCLRCRRHRKGKPVPFLPFSDGYRGMRTKKAFLAGSERRLRKRRIREKERIQAAKDEDSDRGEFIPK